VLNFSKNGPTLKLENEPGEKNKWLPSPKFGEGMRNTREIDTTMEREVEEL